MAISPDDKKAASGDLWGYVHIWDIGTGCCLRVISTTKVDWTVDVDWSLDSICNLAFTSDGSALATACYEDFMIKEWYVEKNADNLQPKSIYRRKRAQRPYYWDDGSKLLLYTQTQRLISASDNGVFEAWNRGSERTCTFHDPEPCDREDDEDDEEEKADEDDDEEEEEEEDEEEEEEKADEDLGYLDAPRIEWAVSKDLSLLFSVTQWHSTKECNMSTYDSSNREGSSAKSSFPLECSNSIGNLCNVAASPMGQEVVVRSETECGMELNVWDYACKYMSTLISTHQGMLHSGGSMCMAYIDRATIIVGVGRDLQKWVLYH